MIRKRCGSLAFQMQSNTKIYLNSLKVIKLRGKEKDGGKRQINWDNPYCSWGYTFFAESQEH